MDMCKRLKDILTDQEIGFLISAKKGITTRDCRKLTRYWRQKEKDGRRRAEVSLSSELPQKFTLFVSVLVDNTNDFSVGLNVQFEDGSNVNLLRCNGYHSGPHKNRLEREFVHGCHIHRATERYIKRKLGAEGYATSTDGYKGVDGAIEKMMLIANIERSDRTQGGDLFDNGNGDQE